MLRETDLCALLPNWRKASCLKQETLADILGVSQALVSKWETGKDVPSRRIAMRLLDAMSATSNDRFLLDRRAMQVSKTIRASFDVDGVKLTMLSQGLSATWPTFSTLINTRLIEHLVDEASHFLHDDSFVKSVRRGEVAMVSAVSDRHVAIDVDARFLHRWTAVFRSYGIRQLVEMTYDTCEPDTPKGVEQIVYFDELLDA